MSYSCNDNQNYFVKEGRTTSRVLSQPGGQASFSMGGWTPEELARQRQAAEERKRKKQEKESSKEEVQAPTKDAHASKTSTPEVVTKENVVNQSPVKATPVAKIPETTLPSASNAPVSANAFASSSTTNSFNVMTGRPTSRVLAPPGGHSSFQL